MPVVVVALRHKGSEVGLVDFAGPRFMYPVRFQGKDTNGRQFWQEDIFSCNSAALSTEKGTVYGLNLIDVNASDLIDCVTCACNTHRPLSGM